jgi:hypothetical protein
MLIHSFIIVSILFLSTTTAYSQLYIGLFSGLSVGIDESSKRGNQDFLFSYGGSALYNLKNITLVTSELSVYYTSLGTRTLNGENDYHTSVMTGDLRTRFYINRDYLFSPYAGIGIGFSFFTNNVKPKNLANPIQPGAGGFLSIPIFLGANTPLNHRFDLDFQFGGVLTNTDNLNPILNNTYDHWIYARIGLNLKMLIEEGKRWN